MLPVVVMIGVQGMRVVVMRAVERMSGGENESGSEDESGSDDESGGEDEWW